MAESDLALSKDENMSVAAERDGYYSKNCKLNKELIAAKKVEKRWPHKFKLASLSSKFEECI